MQTRQFMWGVGVLVGIIVTWRMWFSASNGYRLLAFFVLWGVFYGAVALLLTNPIEWLRYAARQTLSSALALLQLSIRSILKGIAIILGIIYFFSPIDVLPDVILGIGWIDDVLVAYWMWKSASKRNLQIPQLSLHDSYSTEPLKMHGLTAVLSAAPVLLLRWIS